MEDIHAIEQGNSQNLILLSKKAKLAKDDDDVHQELKILAKNYREKDKLFKDFKDCNEKLDHDERDLKEAVKISRTQMQENLGNFQR